MLGHGYQVLYLGSNLPLEQIPQVVDKTDVAAVLLSGTRVDLWDNGFKTKLKDLTRKVDLPIMLGGEFSSAFTDELDALGIHALGSEHVNALEKMQSVIPAFGR